MTGSIDITIRIRLNQDVTPEIAREFVSELDYNIKDTTGLVSIADTEIIEDNVEDESGPIGMDDTPPDDSGVNADDDGSGENLFAAPGNF